MKKEDCVGCSFFLSDAPRCVLYKTEFFTETKIICPCSECLIKTKCRRNMMLTRGKICMPRKSFGKMLLDSETQGKLDESKYRSMYEMWNV